MKRSLIMILVLLAIGAFAVTPAFAMDTCDHGMAHDPTVSGLIAHVQHVYEMGHIDTTGTHRDLTELLDRAAVAAEQGAVEQQVQALQVFIQVAGAQAGKHIDPACAGHLIMHAEHVIMALQGEM